MFALLGSVQREASASGLRPQRLVPRCRIEIEFLMRKFPGPRGSSGLSTSFYLSPRKKPHSTLRYVRSGFDLIFPQSISVPPFPLRYPHGYDVFPCFYRAGSHFLYPRRRFRSLSYLCCTHMQSRSPLFVCESQCPNLGRVGCVWCSSGRRRNPTCG